MAKGPGRPARDRDAARALSALERNIRELCDHLAEDLLRIVRAAITSDPEGPGPAPLRTRRRVRRRAATLRRIADSILAVLSKRGGIAVSEIAAAIGASPRETVRPLTLLLAQGSIEKTGERKGTRYSIAARAGPAPRKPRRVAKPRVRRGGRGGRR
jgi:DNA-binding transcriptional ArsR family regulator